MSDIIHNANSQRFETTIDGITAYLSYVDNGDVWVYDHTIVPSELGGRGLGKALTKYALEHARTQGKKIVPTCSFVVAFIEKNPEYKDIVA